MSLKCWKSIEVYYNILTLCHILLQRLRNRNISFSNATKGGHGSPDHFPLVSVQRDVTDGNTCPQVLTKRLKVEPQCTKLANSNEIHIKFVDDPDTNWFVAWPFGV